MNNFIYIKAYNAEKITKQRGANFTKCMIPFASYAVNDGRLITGQNPFSAKATALKIIEQLQ